MAELDDLALLQAAIGDVSKAKGMGQIAKETGVAAKALQEPRQERQPELPNHYEGRARSRRQADNSTRTSLALRPACSGRPSIGKGRTLTILLRHMWREMFVASLAYITRKLRRLVHSAAHQCGKMLNYAAYFAYIWQILRFVRRLLAYVWQVYVRKAPKHAP